MTKLLRGLGNHRRRALRLSLIGAALAAVLAWASPAQAADVLRPGTKPTFATFGLGPSIMVEPGHHTFFKISQEIGYHFSGDASGAALGLSIEESFIDAFRLGVGPKFWYDIQVARNLGIYLTPQTRLGYGLWTNGATGHSFAWQLGFALRMVLGDVGLVYFKPITPDFYFGDIYGRNFAMSWDIMFGGGVIF